MTDEERAAVIAKLNENRRKQDSRQAAQWAAQVTTPEAIHKRLDYIAIAAGKGLLSEYTAAIYMEALTDALIKAYTPAERRPTT